MREEGDTAWSASKQEGESDLKSHNNENPDSQGGSNERIITEERTMGKVSVADMSKNPNILFFAKNKETINEENNCDHRMEEGHYEEGEAEGDKKRKISEFENVGVDLHEGDMKCMEQDQNSSGSKKILSTRPARDYEYHQLELPRLG